MFFSSARRREQFHEIVYPHLGFVFNVAYRLSGNRYDAEDLTQEAFATAYDKLHQLRDTGRCRFWLLAILRNHYLRSCEKKRPDLLEVTEDDDYFSVLENLAGDDNPEDILIDRMAAQDVQEILLGLPEKYKTPLVLFYTEEWSYLEIAEGLELPIGTVMSRICRGRELIKKEVLGGRKSRGDGKVITPLFDRTSRTGRGES